MKISLPVSILLNIAAIVAGAPTQGTDDPNNSSTVLDLQARGDFVGEHYCGIFANADSNNANDLIQSLGGDKKNNKYSIGARGCYRVACHNTSGVYVCNVSQNKLVLPPPHLFLFISSFSVWYSQE